MEPKPESLWRTSTHKQEDVRTLLVGSRGRIWDLPYCENFDVLDHRFHRDGKGFQGAERTMCKAMKSWWRDKYIYRTKTVLLKDKCQRVHSHVYSTVLKSSINWPWSGATITKVQAWESQILRQTLQNSGRNLGDPQNPNMAVHEDRLEEDGLTNVDGENCE